jgi:hypothetical protein
MQPKKSWQVKNNVKSIICCLDTEGFMLKEFVPPGQSMNGDFYCNVKQLKQNRLHKRSVKWRNNYGPWTCPYITLLVQQILTSTKGTVIPHPPCSPHITLCDFSCVKKLNWRSLGDILSVEEIQAKLQDFMKMLTQNDFHQCFWSQKSCSYHCIVTEWD